MAQTNQVKIGSTTYSIAPAAGATLSFTSSDVADASATTWTTISALANTETMSSIFAKISQMFKNIRYIYNQLSTKAASSHNHASSNITSGTVAIGRVPVSNVQSNSTSTVPTSALVYTLNEGIEELKSKLGV